jgi:hypothetical protein
MQKAKEARKDLKTLSKSVLSVKGGNSALPTNPLGVVADLNADVRGEAADYRDPAIATPQDKAAGEFELLFALSHAGGCCFTAMQCFSCTELYSTQVCQG